MRQGRTDPNSGRMTVALAGLLGVAAIIAYTANTARPRAEIAAPVAGTDGSQNLAELGARAATARGMLDNEQMARLVGELERFEGSTTLATKATAAKVELLELHAAIALEASIRAEVDAAGREAAQKVAAKSIARARELGVEIGQYGADRGRVDAALARAELASGADLTESFPLLLLPSFRDPELRAAAISAPLWRGPEPTAALADSILAQLKAADRQTALVRLLTAHALARSDDQDAAAAQIDDVLADVPRQPLARALQRTLTTPTVVAMAKPTPADEEPVVIDPIEASPAIPDPQPEPTPTAKPIPPVDTTAEPDPVIDPPDVTPKPAPKPATPKPATPKPDGEPKKNGYESLLSEGCKLVRAGDAAAGFELLQKAFDLNPNAVAVTVCMAEAHHALGRDASARALCERALRKSPSDRRALLLAAELEIKRGNESAALGHYRKILEKNPDDSKAKAYVEAH